MWRATFAADGFPAYYGAVVRLLTLTACRRAEVAQMQPAQIEGRVWTVAGAVTKNSTAHRVYLTALALAQLPAAREDGRLFPRGISWPRCKFALDRAPASGIGPCTISGAPRPRASPRWARRPASSRPCSITGRRSWCARIRSRIAMKRSAQRGSGGPGMSGRSWAELALSGTTPPACRRSTSAAR
jgi:integrase